MGTSWLNSHLETFVKPYLGAVPSESAIKFFSAEEMTVIKNCWRSVKSSAMGKKILLAGRDVFVFEILARREGYHTLFLPECSRASVGAIRVEETNRVFLFDTGFAGTIPKRLGVENFKLLSYSVRGDRVQIFPRLTFSRGLALKIEKTPKYWETGRVVDGQVFQELTRKEEFTKAAQLTIEVYKNSSSRFVEKSKPIGGERRWDLML